MRSPLLALAFAFGTCGLLAERSLCASVDDADFHAAEPALRALVTEALESNPGIQEMDARYRSALERAPQVKALPEPMLTFGQFLRSVETRVGPQINTFVLSQSFPWFGKLGLRERVAAQDALAALQMVRAREREVIFQVKRTFYDLAYVDAALRVTEEERSLLAHYEELARTRYATGQGLQQSVLKLQAELTQVLNRSETLNQQRGALVARLDNLLARKSESRIPEIVLEPQPQEEIDLSALYELGDAHRPELAASSERIEKSQKSIELARKSSRPDFIVGLGFVHVGDRSDPAGVMTPPPDNGKNALSLSAGISLPVWRDKYDASLREASETLVAERASYESLRDEMELSIRDQVLRVQTLQDQMRLFSEVLIPQAEQVLSSTEAAYETGQLGVLDLLDGERVLLGVRLTGARYESDRLSALAAIERAIGTRFPR
jgi:outer membrane protein, heavy metal efflux system